MNKQDREELKWSAQAWECYHLNKKLAIKSIEGCDKCPVKRFYEMQKECQVPLTVKLLIDANIDPPRSVKRATKLY